MKIWNTTSSESGLGKSYLITSHMISLTEAGFIYILLYTRVILDGPQATIPAREGQNMACESLKNRMPGYTFYWIS